MSGVSGVTLGLVAAVAAMGGAGAMYVAGAGSGGGDRAEIETVVRSYLLAHPEIIPEAMTALQAREQGRLVAANRAAITTPFPGAEMGNPRGDVTVVEFFDYACGFCRQSLGDVKRLVASDPDVRVVFRELPILSAESEQAARASLAAAQQGRYVAFHDALYAAGRPSAASIRQTVAAVGLDPVRLTGAMRSPAVERELAANLRLARSIGATGTPAWVVGDQVLAGAVGYDALARAVAAARAAR